MTGALMMKFMVLAALLVTATAQAKTVSVTCETAAGARVRSHLEFSYGAEGLKALSDKNSYGDFDTKTSKYGPPSFKLTSNGAQDAISIKVFPYEQAYMPYETRNIEVSISGCDAQGTGSGQLTQRPYRMGEMTADMSCTCSSEAK
jgi:hypothetical protein